LRGAQGRLVSNSDRIKAVKLIDEARENGFRLEAACRGLDICSRTYQRWTKDDSVKKDQRPIIERKSPKNKLTELERKEIIKITNSKEYADLPPSKIAPKLADKGKYIVSESTFYRVLEEEKLNTHRSKSKEPVKTETPTHIAVEPNQVWTWDITWLN
jgi:hypothetical protein